MNPNDHAAPHEHAYTPPEPDAPAAEPAPVHVVSDPFTQAMLAVIQAALPLLIEGRELEKRRSRMNAFRSYALGLMVAGKSWPEAEGLAKDILAAEDSAGVEGS